jgi:hypothetical protein
VIDKKLHQLQVKDKQYNRQSPQRHKGIVLCPNNNNAATCVTADFYNQF